MIFFKIFKFRASLRTLFFQGIPIFLRKNKLISFGKMEIPWKNSVSKLALRASLGTIFFYSIFIFFKGN
jgi:hypothetical protein